MNLLCRAAELTKEQPESGTPTRRGETSAEGADSTDLKRGFLSCSRKQQATIRRASPALPAYGPVMRVTAQVSSALFFVALP